MKMTMTNPFSIWARTELKERMSNIDLLLTNFTQSYCCLKMYDCHNQLQDHCPIHAEVCPTAKSWSRTNVQSYISPRKITTCHDTRKMWQITSYALFPILFSSPTFIPAMVTWSQSVMQYKRDKKYKMAVYFKFYFTVIRWTNWSIIIAGKIPQMTRQQWLCQRQWWWW